MSELIKELKINNQRIYDAGYNSGKQAEYDAFWDAFQDNGKPTSYSRAFSANWRSLDLFKPKYDIIATEAYMIFNAFPLEIDLPLFSANWIF